MLNLRTLIRTEAQIIRDLHARIHETYSNSRNDPAALHLWKQACANFHGYVSRIDRFLTGEAISELRSGSQEMIEFSLIFIEENPRFFGSGYIKERLLRLLRNVTFTPSQLARLHAVQIGAVRAEWRREFRYHCRLAVTVSTNEFMEELQKLQHTTTDAGVATRARMMMGYVTKHRQPATKSGTNTTS